MPSRRIRFFPVIGIAFCLLVAVRVVARPGEPNSEAQQRAMFYQAETAKALTQHSWRVAGNSPGYLSATHPLALSGANFGDPTHGALVAYLTVKFLPKTAGRTDIQAGIVMYMNFGSVYGGERIPQGPFPLNDDAKKKDLVKILAEARERLVAKHPEFAER